MSYEIRLVSDDPAVGGTSGADVVGAIQSANTTALEDEIAADVTSTAGASYGFTFNPIPDPVVSIVTMTRTTTGTSVTTTATTTASSSGSTATGAITTEAPTSTMPPAAGYSEVPGTSAAAASLLAVSLLLGLVCCCLGTGVRFAVRRRRHAGCGNSCDGEGGPSAVMDAAEAASPKLAPAGGGRQPAGSSSAQPDDEPEPDLEAGELDEASAGGVPKGKSSATGAGALEFVAGEESMDGFWRTSSESLVQISGNLIAWTSGERSWLMVKTNDEISIDMHGESYHAKLVGGNLHWDDGDVWIRQKDQDLRLTLEDIRIGSTVQVLEDTQAVLSACRRAGLGTYKDDKRRNLAGSPVKAVKKEPYDETVKCLVPDGGTVWFAVSALTLPQAPAALLRLACPLGMTEMAGDYMLVGESASSTSASSSHSGMPVWKHVSADYWLYTSLDGRWHFGDSDHKERASNFGFVVNDNVHWGVMPHQIRGRWKWLDGKKYVEDDGISVTRVTRRSDHPSASDLASINIALGAFSSQSQPDVPESVWREWAKTCDKELV